MIALVRSSYTNKRVYPPSDRTITNTCNLFNIHRLINLEQRQKIIEIETNERILSLLVRKTEPRSAGRMACERQRYTPIHHLLSRRVQRGIERADAEARGSHGPVGNQRVVAANVIQRTKSRSSISADREILTVRRGLAWPLIFSRINRFQSRARVHEERPQQLPFENERHVRRASETEIIKRL